MTQFNPPIDEPRFGEAQFDSEMTPTGPAPMSSMAVAGFVSSLVLCCPVLSPLLGLIFSIVGLAKTADGRARGRGFAIAGLAISLIVGFPGQAYFGYWSFNYARGFAMVIDAVGNDLNKGDVEECAATLHRMSSEGFKFAVTQDQLKEWIENRLRELGGLKGIMGSQLDSATRRTSGGNQIELPFTAQFPDKNVQIVVRLRFDLATGHMLVDNIAIDDDWIVGGKTEQADEPAEPVDAKEGA